MSTDTLVKSASCKVFVLIALRCGLIFRATHRKDKYLLLGSNVGSEACLLISCPLSTKAFPARQHTGTTRLKRDPVLTSSYLRYFCSDTLVVVLPCPWQQSTRPLQFKGNEKLQSSRPKGCEMVTIGLPSPLVSILVSLISCIIELLFLKALRNIISIWEHSLLENHLPLPLKSHVRRVSIAQAVPLICFITLEIVFSSFSASTPIQIRKDEACTSLRLSVDTNFSDSVFTNEARRVFATCLRVTGDVASVHLGNFSHVSNMTTCGESAVYRFKFEDEQELETKGGTHDCVSVDSVAICAWVKKEGSTLWMSEQSGGDALFHQKAYFSRTELLFEVDDAFLPFLTERVAKVYSIGSYFFRRKVLLDSVEDVCSFVDKQKDGTNVPNAVAALLLVVWSVMISGFCLSCLVRGRRLYDVANAFEMVTRTVRADDDDQVYPIQNAAVLRLQGSSCDARFVMHSIDDVY